MKVEAMFFRYLVVASLLLIGCATAQDEPVVEGRRIVGARVFVPIAELHEDSRCSSPSGDIIDLREFLFLRNTVIEPTMGFSAYRVTVEDERAIVTEFAGDEEIARVFRIDHLVSPNANVDVELSFALFQGRLFVHWRETFQHQRYRHGLFQLNGAELESVCTGVSGIDTTH